MIQINSKMMQNATKDMRQKATKTLNYAFSLPAATAVL